MNSLIQLNYYTDSDGNINPNGFGTDKAAVSNTNDNYINEDIYNIVEYFEGQTVEQQNNSSIKFKVNSSNYNVKQKLDSVDSIFIGEDSGKNISLNLFPVSVTDKDQISSDVSLELVGVDNQGVGLKNLIELTHGTNNTTLGYSAMEESTIGTYNTAIGLCIRRK